VNYDRALVERLLPTLWDPDAVFGVPVPSAPPTDMPRGSVNKKEGNTLWAHLADIRSGWANTELTVNERRAIVLRYGMDWTETEIAKNQRTSQSRISVRLYTGVGKTVAHLNGSEFLEELAA
jgi:DNA-directed RNA polymerase specialized sigma24 family protein